MAEYKAVNATQLDTDLVNVASAIRKKTGDVATLNFPNGFIEGVDAVYNKGKDDMQKVWWNEISNSERYTYSYGFYEFDFNKVGGFVPPNKLIPSKADNMFFKASGLGKVTKEQLDFANATILDKAFYNSDVTEIEYFNPYSCSSLKSTFAYCYYLHTIDTLYLVTSEEDRFLSSTFNYTSKLANINNIIGAFKNDVSFAYSPLTLESAIRVIMALSTSPVSMSVTITFKQSVWDLLSTNPPSSLGYEDIAASSQDDWKMYILSRGWMYS